VDVLLEDGVAEADVERWAPSAPVLRSNNHGRLDPKDLYGWQANKEAGVREQL
jgi:hypothetical protein